MPMNHTPDVPVLATRNLSKRYASQVAAVSNLDLTVYQGEIYGFLGPNGAGKTTTLKMLLGLIRPTAGTITILGHVPGHPAALARIGALIETPAFYPYLSGRDNLRVMAQYAHAAPERVEIVLQEVGLTKRADHQFQHYSLGMKQRLGVAAALLKNPDLLILDEPSNGLDPQGMADMRELLHRLRERGQTVLVSSHLLGEVEQVCDRIGVIQQGTLVAEGALTALLGADILLIRAHPVAQAHQLLLDLLGAECVTLAEEVLQLRVDLACAGELNTRLVQAGIVVSELRPVSQTLEDLFLSLTDAREVA